MIKKLIWKLIARKIPCYKVCTGCRWAELCRKELQ